MSLIKLHRSFEERRNNLVEKLEKNRSELDLSQQHQIYGAIKEIEKFLQSIEYHRTLEADNSFDLELSQEREWPILQRTQRACKKTARGTKKCLRWTFIHLPQMTIKSLKGQYSEYQKRREMEKEVRREVERRLREKK